MAGAIGDINQGLIGISRTTGNENQAIPEKKIAKVSPGNNIIVHTESALTLQDSGNHIMDFIRGKNLSSYAPQEQKELRSATMEHIQKQRAVLEGKEGSEAMETTLQSMHKLLKQDEELEMMANMARNVLLSA